MRALTALALALLVADHLASPHCRGSLSSHGTLMRKTVNFKPKAQKALKHPLETRGWFFEVCVDAVREGLEAKAEPGVVATFQR